eukprot:gene11173-biopygen21375
MAWLGLAWLGLAWLGLAWSGSVRFGSVRFVFRGGGDKTTPKAQKKRCTNCAEESRIQERESHTKMAAILQKSGTELGESRTKNGRLISQACGTLPALVLVLKNQGIEGNGTCGDQKMEKK